MINVLIFDLKISIKTNADKNYVSCKKLHINKKQQWIENMILKSILNDVEKI